MVAEPFGEFPGIFALAAFIAAHVQGLADQEQADAPFIGYPAQRLQIFPDTIPLERFDALRRDAQFVADRKADAFFADIERENAGIVRADSGVGEHLIRE